MNTSNSFNYGIVFLVNVNDLIKVNIGHMLGRHNELQFLSRDHGLLVFKF